MIDLHCHILPGIDDGSKTMDETLEMARIAISEGINYIICTPHYIQHSDYRNKTEVESLVEEVNKKLLEEGIQLTLSAGHEIYMTPDLPQLVKEGEVSTLNNSQYILVEFPMNDIPLYAEDIFYELKLMGLTPVLAHPERYPLVRENPNLLLNYINQGVLCQMNMGSIRGLFGEKIQQTAIQLIKHHMIHFVATDAHSQRHRAPRMQEAFEVVKGIDETLAEELFITNPEKVYRNELFEPRQPIEIVKKSFWRSLFSR